MSIFNKGNGTIPLRYIPFNQTKKFLDISKTTKNNPVLQRNGAKISYAFIINVLQISAINRHGRNIYIILNINKLNP